jgi:hypothetical protein
VDATPTSRESSGEGAASTKRRLFLHLLVLRVAPSFAGLRRGRHAQLQHSPFKTEGKEFYRSKRRKEEFYTKVAKAVRKQDFTEGNEGNKEAEVLPVW